MTDEKQEYLRIDEKENAIDFLHRAAEFFENTKSNSYNWKWFIIAIHHATHSFMLIVLQNTDLSELWSENFSRQNKRGPRKALVPLLFVNWKIPQSLIAV